MKVNTVFGEMEESTLIRSEGTEENNGVTLHWVEYRQSADGPIVHRSVHIEVKQAAAESAAHS